jgi:hypothetical protein
LKLPYLRASYTKSVGPIKFCIEIYLPRLLFFKTLRRLGAIFETPVYEDKISRFMTKTMFERKLLNREKHPRKWLIYSPSTGEVYCGPCLLFGGGTSFGKEDVGFNDWKNARKRM